MSESEQMTEEILEISEGDSEEVRNLKRMVLTFKKRYQRVLQTTSSPVKDEEQKALIEQQMLLKEMLQKVQQESEEKIGNLTQELQAVSETANSLKIENESLKNSQIEILSAREKEDVAVDLTSEDSYQRLNALQKENRDLKEQQGQLKEFLKEAQEEFIQVKEELLKVKLRLENSDRSLKDLEQQNVALREQHCEQDEIRLSEVKKLQGQLETLKDHLATAEEENNLLKMRAEKANVTLDQRKEEIERIKEQEESLEKYKVHLTESLEENNRLKAELATFEEVAKLAQQEAIQKSGELDEALKKLQTALEISEGMQREVQALSEENIQLKSEGEDKEELIQELDLIKGQFGKLKSEILANREKINAAESNLEESQRNVQELEDDNQKLQTELEEREGKIEKLDKELFTMKQSLLQGLREAKEYKEHYQRAASERTSMIQKSIRVQQQMQDLKEELAKKDAEMQQILSEVDHQKGFENILKEKEEEISTLTNKVKATESELQQLKNSKDESDQQVQQAQQHMAKKVKEASELNDLVQQQKQRIEQLEDETEAAQAMKAEAKTSMESYVKQERQMQEQIKNWEGKYFHIYDQWKELEVQNKELKKLEEKYEQMQEFLSNFGNFTMGAEKPKRPPQMPKPIKKAPPKKEVIENDVDLFSMKPSSQPTKHNFFE